MEKSSNYCWLTPACHYPITRKAAPNRTTAIQYMSFSTVRNAETGQQESLLTLVESAKNLPLLLLLSADVHEDFYFLPTTLL
jgi:hypothetical protein